MTLQRRERLKKQSAFNSLDVINSDMEKERSRLLEVKKLCDRLGINNMKSQSDRHRNDQN